MGTLRRDRRRNTRTVHDEATEYNTAGEFNRRLTESDWFAAAEDARRQRFANGSDREYRRRHLIDFAHMGTGRIQPGIQRYGHRLL